MVVSYSSSLSQTCPFPLPREQRTLNPSRIEYEYLEQGSAVFRREAALPEGTQPSRASFAQGDACSLDVETLGSFDAVLASNLLCRYVPQGFVPYCMCSLLLENMSLVVLFTSPCKSAAKVFLSRKDKNPVSDFGGQVLVVGNVGWSTATIAFLFRALSRSVDMLPAGGWLAAWFSRAVYL